VNRREIVLSIIIVAMFVLVTICTVRTSIIGRRLSELELEQERSCNVSVSVTCDPTLPLKARAIDLRNADIGQDHLEANNQLGLSIDTEHIATPETCASQWLDNAITVRETLDCIKNSSKCKGKHHESFNAKGRGAGSVYIFRGCSPGKGATMFH
jgi:hypothetical protein